MKCFQIRVADLVMEITARGRLTEEICQEYRCHSSFIHLSAYATPKEIVAKQQSIPIGLTQEQAECMCLYDKICLQLVRYDAFLLHAAVVQCEGRTYAFVAPRGEGKTTHAHLWREAYGTNVRILNGDKPIIRRMTDGRYWAYGTPWCGKEREQVNAGAPLDGVCFLSRGETDSVRSVGAAEYLDLLIHQVVFPEDSASMNRGAKLLAGFISDVPAVAATCTMNVHAVFPVRAALDRL
mgnify:CR=1 FL=1